MEQLLQAELAHRNDALAAARSESGRVTDTLQVVELNLQQEHHRAQRWEQECYKARESLEKECIKARMLTEALGAENKSLRKNNEALAAELDALASSVNRHMMHPRTSAAASSLAVIAGSLPLGTSPIPIRLQAGDGNIPGMRVRGGGGGRGGGSSSAGKVQSPDLVPPALSGGSHWGMTNGGREGGGGGGGVLSVLVSDSPWGSPVLSRGSPT